MLSSPSLSLVTDWHSVYCHYLCHCQHDNMTTSCQQSLLNRTDWQHDIGHFWFPAVPVLFLATLNRPVSAVCFPLWCLILSNKPPSWWTPWELTVSAEGRGEPRSWWWPESGCRLQLQCCPRLEAQPIPHSITGERVKHVPYVLCTM